MRWIAALFRKVRDYHAATASATTAVAVALSLGVAHAQVNQPVYQTGTITYHHPVGWVQPGVIGDLEAGGGFVQTTITNTGLPFCIYDAPISSSSGYHQLCLGANATVLGTTGGWITYNAYGGAANLPLNCEVNGAQFSCLQGTGGGNVNGVPGPANDVVLWAGGLNIKDAPGWSFNGTLVTQPATSFTGSITVPGLATTTFAPQGGASLQSAAPGQLVTAFGGSAQTFGTTGSLGLTSAGEQPIISLNRVDTPIFSDTYPEGEILFTGMDLKGVQTNWCTERVVTETLGASMLTDSADLKLLCMSAGASVPVFSAGAAGVGVSLLYPIGPTSGPLFAGDGDTSGYAPLEQASTNLLTFSNALENGAWTASNATVTAGASGQTPFGGTDGESAASTATGGYVQQGATISSSTGVYVASIYISSTSGATTPALDLIFTGGNSYVCTLNINSGVPILSTLSVGATTPTACSFVLTPATVGGQFWYRLYVAGANTSNTTVSLRFYPNGGTGVAATAITYGAQLEANAAPAAYQPSAYIYTSGHSVARPALALTPRLIPYKVADLPSCGTAQEGRIVEVTDAAASPVYNATVSSGGSVHMPVFCNGTNWTNH